MSKSLTEIKKERMKEIIDVDHEIRDLKIATKNLTEKYESRIQEAFDSGYTIGLASGLQKGTEIEKDIEEISNKLISESIKYVDSIFVLEIFIKFCYLNGIDFSYMAKHPGDNFCDRVKHEFLEYLHETAQNTISKNSQKLQPIHLNNDFIDINELKEVDRDPSSPLMHKQEEKRE